MCIRDRAIEAEYYARFGVKRNRAVMDAILRRPQCVYYCLGKGLECSPRLGCGSRRRTQKESYVCCRKQAYERSVIVSINKANNSDGWELHYFSQRHHQHLQRHQ